MAATSLPVPKIGNQKNSPTGATLTVVEGITDVHAASLPAHIERIAGPFKGETEEMRFGVRASKRAPH